MDLRKSLKSSPYAVFAWRLTKISAFMIKVSPEGISVLSDKTMTSAWNQFGCN